jgi:two-component system, NarL family, sensor kinase
MEEMIIYLTLALLLLGGIVLFFFVVYRFKLNRSIRERKEIEAKNVQTLLQTKVEIRDQTLKDVSLEIHDNIAQVLSLAKLHLSSAQSEDPELVSVRLGSAKDLVSRAIRDLRDLSKLLATDQISHFDLVLAVEQQVEQIKKAGSHEVQFSVSGVPSDIGHHNGIILFRIIQEALQNILKHADATKVELTITYGDADLSVHVVDNGSGFDVVNSIKGQGLENIRERASLLGASCVIDSVVGNGTIVNIVMPVNVIT